MIRQQLKQYFIFYEPLMRFELMTSSLPRKRSTPELQRQNNMSGKRDSNSRPSAWKADALSTELFPQNTQTLQHLRELIHCGESRIRTYEDKVSGVTVRPSWPLWYLPNNKFKKNEPVAGFEPTTC